MKNKFLSGGEFPPHEILEVLLGFAIPRKNTNDIAHRLLEHFGTLDGVLNASYEELLSVRGMGVQSAFLIYTAAMLGRSVRTGRTEAAVCLDSIGKLGNYGIALFEGMTEETVYAVLLDSKLSLVDCIRLSGGTHAKAEVKLFDVASCPSADKCAAAVLFHNHPDGSTEVSEADRDFAARTRELFAVGGVEVIEHIIVAGETYRTVMREEKTNE